LNSFDAFTDPAYNQLPSSEQLARDRRMSSESSDTRWLNLLKAGNHTAAQVLWERYFRLLVSCARQHLGAAPRGAADEEDVALSAFASFCRGVERGRFLRLEDREDLRSVLLMLVARKSAHQVRDERCGKRGGGKVSAEADLPRQADDEEVLAQLIDSEPTPQLAAQMADECQRLLAKLSDDDLRAIALWQMEGYTVEEIAPKLGRSPRTVARKLAEIRDRWSDERPT
jgi:RNA polymerase sigma factor (sigma-70 family)